MSNKSLRPLYTVGTGFCNTFVKRSATEPTSSVADLLTKSAHGKTKMEIGSKQDYILSLGYLNIIMHLFDEHDIHHDQFQ